MRLVRLQDWPSGRPLLQAGRVALHEAAICQVLTAWHAPEDAPTGIDAPASPPARGAPGGPPLTVPGQPEPGQGRPGGAAAEGGAGRGGRRDAGRRPAQEAQAAAGRVGAGAAEEALSSSAGGAEVLAALQGHSNVLIER